MLLHIVPLKRVFVGGGDDGVRVCVLGGQTDKDSEPKNEREKAESVYYTINPY